MPPPLVQPLPLVMLPIPVLDVYEMAVETQYSGVPSIDGKEGGWGLSKKISPLR